MFWGLWNFTQRPQPSLSAAAPLGPLESLFTAASTAEEVGLFTGETKAQNLLYQLCSWTATEHTVRKQLTSPCLMCGVVKGWINCGPLTFLPPSSFHVDHNGIREFFLSYTTDRWKPVRARIWQLWQEKQWDPCFPCKTLSLREVPCGLTVCVQLQQKFFLILFSFQTLISPPYPLLFPLLVITWAPCSAAYLFSIPSSASQYTYIHKNFPQFPARLSVVFQPSSVWPPVCLHFLLVSLCPVSQQSVAEPCFRTSTL